MERMAHICTHAQSASASQRVMCVSSCKHAEDQVGHYLLCDVTWQFPSRPVPHGLGVRQSMRNLQAMMLTENNMDTKELVRMAVGIYAASIAVQQIKSSHALLQPAPLLRLYAAEGLRGSKIKFTQACNRNT